MHGRASVALPAAGAGAMARPPRPCRPPFFSLRNWLSRLHVAAKPVVVLSLAGACPAMAPAAPFSSSLSPSSPSGPLLFTRWPQLTGRAGTPLRSFLCVSVYHRDREPSDKLSRAFPPLANGPLPPPLIARANEPASGTGGQPGRGPGPGRRRRRAASHETRDGPAERVVVLGE